MNALNIVPLNQTMSSREIAELTGKEHKNVKRDCEVMFSELSLDALSFEHIYLDSMNRQQTEYLLTRDLVETLITGYSIKLRFAVIQRLRQLENQVSTFDIKNPVHLLQAVEAQAKLNIELTHQVETLTPKAIALDRIADTESLFTIRQAAKTIKIKERDLVAMLLNRGWAFRDARSVMQPYAEKIAMGYVTSVMTKPITGNDGQDRVFSQLRITAKGVTRLSYLAAKELAA